MKQILALVAITLLGLTTMYQQKETHFVQWKKLHNKQYSEVEEQYRRMVFEQNVEMINAHNSDPTQTYTMEANRFADLTKEEYIATYLNPELYRGVKRAPATFQSNESYDWRNTTTVRDMQSGCIASWALSAVGTAESYIAVVKGEKVTLSPQQIIDCDTTSFSCNGGIPRNAVNYIANYGTTTEGAYPYVSKFQPCKKNGGPYTVNGVDEVEDLQGALRSYAVSVVVDAANWQFYKTGIFSNCDDEINLSVVAVGFTDTYWIVQSVYGTGWGQNGYIYLAPGDTCGIQDLAYRAI